MQGHRISIFAPTRYFLVLVSRSKMKVVLLLCVTLAVASAKCPNGWTLAEDICILIIDQPFTFLQASNECESRGGSLMSMRSRKDELLLLSVALKTHQPHLKGWINGYRSAYEKDFYESDGIAVSYENWLSPLCVSHKVHTAVCKHVALIAHAGLIKQCTLQCSDVEAAICEQPREAIIDDLTSSETEPPTSTDSYSIPDVLVNDQILSLDVETNEIDDSKNL